MKRRDFKTEWDDLRKRFKHLPQDRQERAMEAFMEALTLCELPADPGETLEIVVSLKRSSETTYRSG